MQLAAYRLPILAGLLIGTSYIPFPPWALFFCLVPLWLFTLRAENVRQAFWGGWIAQFLLNLIGFHWIAHTAVDFGHFPWPAGILVLLGFCAIAHLYFPVSTAVWVWINKRRPLSPLAGILLLAGLLAMFKNIFPVLFPWHFGYPWLWANFPAAQATDLIGFEGLNFLSILINALFTFAWLNRSNKKIALSYVATAVAAFIFINVVGSTRKAEWDKTDAQINILAVQGNIGNFEKLQAEKGAGYQDSIVDRYANLTREGILKHPDTDVVIWPETAFPNYLDTHRVNHSLVISLKAFVSSINKPLLTGAYSRDLVTKATYNGFFGMNTDGSLAADPPYRKTMLLAFGEYFPGADLFPFVMKLFPDQSAFGRGPGPTVLNWQNWKIGQQICYEGLYPWFTNGLVRADAEVLTNVTNDSWFGNTFEPYQHLYMTLARAIEFRRPLMRSTNTGITTAILANGQILEQSPLHQEWTGLFKIPYRRNPPKTFYSYLEPFWPWLFLAFNVVLIAAFSRKTR